tara:strand:+ start:229 stop:699 length:471 start_codon:yes stop_codon:yes gene_type:complete
MMDLVILALAAFYFGRHFDQLDFDFSQNQENSEDELPDTIPAKFTEWTLMQEANDAKYPTDTYSLYERKYVQGDVILFTQYKIEKNGSVFRSGYREYEEAAAVYEDSIRPRTPEEQARFDEIAAAKEQETSQNQEKPAFQNPIDLSDRSRQSGGVM